MIAEAQRALTGIWRMMRGDDDVSAYFNASTQGFWRSFSAAVYALPLYVMLVMVQAHLGAPYESVLNVVVIYAVIWLLFPLTALILLRLQGNMPAFVPWVVVHNWAVVVIFAVQLFPLLLFTAGVLPASIVGILLMAAIPIALFIHYRVCRVATEAPMMFAFAMVCVHVLASYGAQIWIDQQFQQPVNDDNIVMLRAPDAR